MNVHTINDKAMHTMLHTYNLLFKTFVLAVLVFFMAHASLQAQEYTYAKPTFLVGIAAGANFNFHRGTTQNLNAGFTSPVPFHNGNNVGLYLAPLLEYQSPSGFGAMLQIGYDNRSSKFEQQITVCNCPADLSTRLSYLTVEPSLRYAPFKNGFYLYGGPRFAFNLEKAFTYKLGINPAFPDQLPTADVTGDMSDVKSALLSVQVGLGYDIPVSSQNNKWQAIVSPFISFQPYIGQSPRSVESWNITTFRVGAALKFGAGEKNPVPTSNNVILPLSDGVRFSVISPENIPEQRRVKEIFPLRNDVFFNEGSTEIPGRYVLLSKSQIANFKEDNLDAFVPKNLSGRSDRGMTVYYNVLNILGDRLGKNPSSTISLVGFSAKGQEDAKEMAESVKKYLTDIWNINGSRISVEGREKNLAAAQQASGSKDNPMLLEGDRKVTILSTSAPLLMEFQSGADAKLKPVEFTAIQIAPLDSYLTFNVEGARSAFSSWRLEIKDENGKVQNFGPFTAEQVRIPGKNILGVRPKGRYNVKMIGTTKSGALVTKDANVNMVLWKPASDELGSRYSVIYDFDESKAINIYEKYLTSVIAPSIPRGSTVIVQGHTDIIGSEEYNQTLSLARANDVKSILLNELKRTGRNDVKFEVHGMGEDNTTSPFDNALPEQRAYNRTVLIEIVPRK
jgi:outer membrane protein OmpA-like peptidoglycan-associated protein